MRSCKGKREASLGSGRRAGVKGKQKSRRGVRQADVLRQIHFSSSLQNSQDTEIDFFKNSLPKYPLESGHPHLKIADQEFPFQEIPQTWSLLGVCPELPCQLTIPMHHTYDERPLWYSLGFFFNACYMTHPLLHMHSSTIMYNHAPHNISFQSMTDSMYNSAPLRSQWSRKIPITY